MCSVCFLYCFYHTVVWVLASTVLFVFSAVSNTKMAPEWFVVIQSFCLCKQIWRLAAKVYVSSKYVSTLKRINNINFNCVDVL